MSWQQHLLFLLCVAVAGYVQNLTGFAFGLILLGLAGIFHVAPVPDVANVVSMLTLINATVMFRATPPRADRQLMRPLLTASLVGVALGVLLLNWLSDNVVAGLRLLLGLTIASCAVILVLRRAPLPHRSSDASFAAIGALSGVLGGLFSSAGPPLVYHLYRQPMDPRAVRDTLVLTFAANAAVRLTMVLLTGRLQWHMLLMCLEAAPLVMAQTWWMARHPPTWPAHQVRRVVCVLLLVAGLSLVGPSLHALLM